MNKLIVTRIPSREKNIISGVYNGTRFVEIDSQNMEEKSILKNIYVAKVKNIVKNINAAFVEVENGLECYYSLEENKNHIFLNGKQKEDKLVQGDLILVQVIKENIKTKAPVVSSNISISGKYIAISYGDNKIGISNKLGNKDKIRLKKILEPYENQKFGIVARTNAKNAKDQEIFEEIEIIQKKLENILKISKYRSCYSCLYKEPENYIGFLKTLNHKELEEVVTDDEGVYNDFLDYMKENPVENITVRLYKDELLPLYKLYSMEKAISDALSTKVWLKSGAYLVIEPTEAFTVIDINTGKYDGNKKIQDTFLKINLEAAKEIAMQLRLRNISGIVVVDFIDMKSEKDIENLMQEFNKYLKQDVVTTNLVGRSPLNLVELTRKKVRKSLREQLCTECTCCHGRGYL